MARIALITLLATTLGCGGAKPIEPAPVVPEPPPVEEQVDDEPLLETNGRAMYEQVCVTCHGKTGDGTGLDQQLFSFAAPEEEWKNGASKDGIIITLAQGTHDSSMQSFAQYREKEREAVADYVLELRASLLATPSE